jgi:hypothetical protein
MEKKAEQMTKEIPWEEPNGWMVMENPIKSNG